MAIYNEILVGRYNRALQKLLGIKGEAPAPALAGEITAMHLFFTGVENRYLESWERFAVQNTAAAGGVGNNSGLRMRNPLASNVIAVFEKITVFNTAGAADIPALQRATTVTDLTNVVGLGSNRMPDSRQRPSPTLILSNTGVHASTGITMAALATPANASGEFILFEEQEIPLLPGEAVDVSSNNANAAFGAVFWWRERSLEEGERT